MGYLAQLAHHLDATPREGGGDVLAMPPDTVTANPPGVAMTPGDIAKANAFMAAPPVYGSGPAPAVFDQGPKPGANFFAVPNPVDDALAKGLVTAPREGVSTDFQHDVQGPPAGPPPPPNVNAPEQPPVLGAPPPFPLVSGGGGGVIPAHEVERRGPTFKAAEANANDAAANAIQSGTARTQRMADVDYGMALDQERQAQVRAEAADQAAAERAQELQQRAQDFDSSVKDLSRISIDPDRFWASRSTGQKVSAMIAIGLGGFLQGARGGTNPGLDMINQQIDRDIHAQEFAYQAARDTAGMKQTAFALAMQKYGSLDAARAAARAAALDAVQAQVAQSAALWKGTSSATEAEKMMADLERLKAQQIQQGIAFVPATQAPRMFYDPETKLTYNEAQARELAKEYRGYGQDIGKVQAQQYGAQVLEKLKLEGKDNEKADQGAKYISEQTRAAGIPEALSAAEQARQALNGSPRGTGERAAVGLNVGGAANPTMHKLYFGDEAAAREQAWTAFKARAIRALAGTRGESSPQVAEMVNKLEGAGDTQSRLNMIKNVEAALAADAQNIRAGASPEAQAQYERQAAAAKTGVPTTITGIPGVKAVK